MEQTFGARLRAERERRQIAIGDIANSTKIKCSLLEAIEGDDIARLPEGLFRRAYVRSYAQAIGLDAAEIVREFLALYPEPIEEAPQPKGLKGMFATAFGSRAVALPDRAADAAAAPAAESRVDTVPPAASELTPSQTVVPGPTRPPIDLVAVSDVCARLARAATWRDVASLLAEGAELLDAVGLIVWSWDPRLSSLHAAWAHGYSDSVLGRLPRVRKDADNAIAAAYRSADTRIVESTDSETGAVVVPVVTACGCIAVLAIELGPGDAQRDDVRAVATLLAAQLASLLGAAPMAEAETA